MHSRWALRRRLAVAALAVLCFSIGAPARGADAPAAPECLGLPNGGFNVNGLALFARPIGDVNVLALTQRLVHMEKRSRKSFLSAANGSRDPGVRAKVDAAVRAACAGDTLRYAALRAAVELGFTWDEVDDAPLEAFANGPLVVALGAELTRASLAPDVYAAALRGFPDAEPSAPASPAAQCSAADAAWTIGEAKEPTYPRKALQAGEIGTIKANVALDAAGYVESVKLRTAEVDVDPRKGGGEMAYFAIVSAGAAAYRPRKAGCATAPGEFVYRVDYSRDGVAVGAGP